jgi:pilus assembly protein Flp/PilA
MMKLLRNLKNNTSGASAAEYALIVAVLGGVVVAGATAFGGNLRGSMEASGTQINGSHAEVGAIPPQ